MGDNVTAAPVASEPPLPASASAGGDDASPPLATLAALAAVLPAGDPGPASETPSSGDSPSFADASGRSLEEWSASLFSPSELPPSGGTFPTNSLPNSSSAALSVIVLTESGICLPPERRHPGRLSRPKLYDNDLAIHPHDRRLRTVAEQLLE